MMFRTRSERAAARIAIVVAVLAVGLPAAAYYRLPFGLSDSMLDPKTWESLSWRVRVYALKARGGLPEFSWSELRQMTGRRGGFGLRGVVNGRGVAGSVENPYVSDEDHQAGARIFRQRCAMCHGGNGTGWHAPALNHPGLKHGDSDFAIYTVLRDGIAGTSMAAPPRLSPVERWQVVGYLRRLQLQAGIENDGEAPRVDVDISNDRVLTAGTSGDEWLTYSGSLDGRRYAPIGEITPANVSQLRVRWIHQFDSTEAATEATPLVAGGVMFTTEAPSTVVALDARSGHVIWRYTRHLPAALPLCCGRVNRGLAILGHVLFLGSLDGWLVAIDANSGTLIWQVQVTNPSDGYTLTGAPLVVRRSVVVGVAGGEYGVRGFLAAYDADSGREQWKFQTVPGPGERGHETWGNEAWQTGGGTTWVTGSYDPALDLLYWGVGNPAPDFAGDVRPGDNLFTNSVIALRVSSGTLAWHFQFTPHDEHDWDSNQTPILADIRIGGASRHVICWPNRNGFYYVLDRVTGAFLLATPFVEQNWTKGIDAAGRPILWDAGIVPSAGRLTRPGIAGGTNWQNAAFDPQQGLVFVHATEGASVFTRDHAPRRGEHGLYVGSSGAMSDSLKPIVRALDAGTGVQRWEYATPAADATFSGLLATAGGLVWGAAGGSAFAIDSATGQEQWRVFLGGETRAAPISFMLDGHQVLALSAGHAIFLFGS